MKIECGGLDDRVATKSHLGGCDGHGHATQQVILLEELNGRRQQAT